jgi:tripartite ATP-independent transporter DctM subunit
MELWQVSTIFFTSLVFLLLVGLPVSFTLAGLSIIFIVWLMGFKSLFIISSALYGKGTDFVLIAVPLFILMANLLETSGMAENLYDTMYRWLSGIPGGLASGTIVICAIFAAMAGISGVATVTMGLIAIPSMLKHQYDKKMVVGSVMAGGALGILIPPSIIAILYGSITGTSVGKLFMGGMVPGILLSILFIVYLTIMSLVQPHLAPSAPEKFSWKDRVLSLRSVIFPLVLITIVLGTIYTGICTPTESAGIGAVGSMICAAIYRKLTWQTFKTALLRTLSVSCMALWIVFGAGCFSAIYTVSGASYFMNSIISGIDFPPLAMIGIMMLIYLILGMVMDPVGQVMITMPVFLPIVESLGFDPVWFGILFIINSEMGYITPPFGFNLFYMRAIVPPTITMGDIYRSISPFVFVQGICLVLVMFFPNIALWLPNTMR